MNVGIIGAGGIARKFHLPELIAIPGVKVTHIAGRSHARLERLAAVFGISNVSTNYEEVIANPAIDAVVVATPHPLHVPIGLRVLAAQKHLLMQKPLCADAREATEFRAAAESAPVTTMCLPHFTPAVAAARRFAQSGRLGTIASAHCRVSHGGPEVYYAEVRDFFEEAADDLWFFRQDAAAVGALFDMGVYAVSCLAAILGDVREVTGIAATVDKPTELEDTAALLLRFRSGAVGVIETGWCDPAKSWQLGLHGTRGKLVIGGDGRPVFWQPGSYTREDVPATEESVPLAPPPHPTAHETWIAAIREGQQPEMSTAGLASHVSLVLLAGLRSAAEGRTVQVGE